MSRLISIVILIFLCFYADLGTGNAQNPKAPMRWQKISVCQLHFLVPENFKNQYPRGIDSCVSEFKSSKMRLAIDYGSYSGPYKKYESLVDYKEEFVDIGGKKAQVVTYKTADKKPKFIAGMYVLINEAKDGMNTSLNMSIECKNADDLEIAKQIIQSVTFDAYRPFTIEQGGIMPAMQKEHSRLYNGRGVGKRIVDLLKSQDEVIFQEKEPLRIGHLGGWENVDTAVKSFTCNADAVITATVINKASQLSADGNYIFTDFGVTIETVLKNNAGKSLKPQDWVVISQPGGKVVINGKVATVNTRTETSLLIGKNYLFFLNTIPTTGAFQVVPGADVLSTSLENTKNSFDCGSRGGLPNAATTMSLINGIILNGCSAKP